MILDCFGNLKWSLIRSTLLLYNSRYTNQVEMSASYRSSWKHFSLGTLTLFLVIFLFISLDSHQPNRGIHLKMDKVFRHIATKILQHMIEIFFSDSKVTKFSFNNANLQYCQRDNRCFQINMRFSIII